MAIESYSTNNNLFRLNNLRASVPFINNQDISYLNAALAQPIVAFMNTNYTCIPLKFDIDVKKVRHNPP